MKGDIWHDPLFLAGLKRGGAGGSASGDIVTFTGDGSPLRSLRIGIDPVQDLHGFDNPWPAGGGKNKLVPAFSAGTTKTANDVNYLFNSDGTVSVSGTCSDTNSWQDVVSYFSLPAGTYTLSGGVSNSIYLSLRDYNNTSLATSKTGAETFTISETTTVRVRACVLANTVVPSNTILRPMLESGSTATSYAPYSNLCPISGWDEANLWRTGKNLLDVADYQIEASSAYNKSAGATLTFGGTGASVSGTNPIEIAVTTGWRGATFFSKPLKVGATYYLRYRITAPSPGYIKRTIYWVDDDNKIVVNLGYSSSVDQSADYVYHNTLTPPQDGLRLAFVVESQTSQTVTIYDMGVMVEGWETYAPYSGNQFTIQLGQTVYGGYISVSEDGSAELVVDREYLYKTSCAGFSSTVAGCFYVLSNNGVEKQPGLAISNYLKTHNGSGNSAVQPFYSVTQSGGGSTTIWGRLDESYTTKAAVDAYLSQNPLVVVVKLAQPITIPLTPQEITTLAGANVMWADCGDIAVEWAGGKGFGKDAILAWVMRR